MPSLCEEFIHVSSAGIRMRLSHRYSLRIDKAAVLCLWLLGKVCLCLPLSTSYQLLHQKLVRTLFGRRDLQIRLGRYICFGLLKIFLISIVMLHVKERGAARRKPSAGKSKERGKQQIKVIELRIAFSVSLPGDPT